MQRKMGYLFSVCLAVAVGTFAASADTYFTGNLTGGQEVPPTGSTATGFGRVTLNSAETQITASVYYSNLGTGVTAGHIHGPAAVGANAPILFNLNPTAGGTSGSVVAATFAVSPTQVADLKAGLWYFNIHTTGFPGGEIRGQITVDSPHVAYFSSGQENPANASAATGSGVVSINTATNQALVTMRWAGLSGNATAGHVHSGRSGVNGPIVCNLSPSAVASGSVIDFLCNFTGAQMTALRQAQFYLNIHTSANPGGEIRGQIQRRRSTVVDFDGDSKTDFAIARNNTVGGFIEWWILNSSNASVTVSQHGASTDFSTLRLLAADFDGDGKDDPTVYRNLASPNGGFVILQSSNNTLKFEEFGITGDDPRVVYDYDGDGRADVAVFRTSTDTWYYRGSSNNAAGNITFQRWGTTFANPGDYDGDGRGDFVDQQSGLWWLLRSSDGGVQIIQIGTGSAFGVPGDYDGDGKVDQGVTLTENSRNAWYYASSLNPAQSVYATRVEWGPSTGRTRSQGDFDGDGKSDYGVYLTTAPQTFWILPSNGSAPIVQPWGNSSSDFPITGYNNR
jgi:hypothetical protein